MLQNLPIMLCCNSFTYYAQQSPYCAPIMPSFSKQGRRHFSCTFYYSGLSGESIATVVTQLPFKTETLKSITSYTGC